MRPGILVFALMVCAACGSKKDQEDPITNRTFADDRFQVSVGASWKDTDLSPVADLQLAASTGPEAYLVSVVESAEDFPEEVDLETYCAFVVENLQATGFGDLTATRFEEHDQGALYGLKSVINGRAGVMPRIQGWVFCFEGELGFAQLILWTGEADFLKRMKEFEAIVTSFQPTGS
jgi:hypothetical protein